MIAVCIATYNHAPFIEQAVASVRAQQCDEPIRIYIGDDASTDETGAICQTMANEDDRIIYIRREKNIGLSSNTIDLYRRMMKDGCDYIAMLDGDDYWTDTQKLQRQVDYMRTHPEVGFIHTNGRTLSGAKTWTFAPHRAVYDLQSAGFANCTVLFRTELLSTALLETIEAQHFLWLDYPLYGVFYQQTQWAYLQEPTAVWRDHTSVSQPKEARAVLRLREERVRMWRWLEEQFPGKVGYSEQEAQDYLYAQRLNLVYEYADRSLVTEALMKCYKPPFGKQWLKQKCLKNELLYTIVQKISLLFA